MKSIRVWGRLACATLTLVISVRAQALKVVNEQVILEKIDDYHLCQKKDYSGEFCHEALLRWVEKTPADAFKAGKMTRQTMNASQAIPFFAKAFELKQGQCKDRDVSQAVVSALGLPADANKELLEQARTIAFNLCFADVKEAILKEASAESILFANTCQVFLEKKMLTGFKAEKCKAMKGKG